LQDSSVIDLLCASMVLVGSDNLATTDKTALIDDSLQILELADGG
jgi:hypothetical protein